VARPSRKGSTPDRVAQRYREEGYGAQSLRPLHSLVLLVPLILIYEIGSVRYLADPSTGITETIGAHSILLGLFTDLGPLGRFIPATLLVVVLIVWHTFRRDSWRPRLGVVFAMMLESAVWTLPLLVLSLILPMSPNALAATGALPGGVPIADLSWQARVALSAGAGLYEELLFRVVVITLVHLIVVDVLRQASGVGFVLGAVISAISFALYHNIDMPTGGVHFGLLSFYALAGLFFSGLFVWRGFGIAALCHTLYDVIVLVVLPRGD